jgi:tetratricopeptide (TPR) repeat protein
MSKNKFVQPKISPWQKIILIIAGLFLSLFLLEIGLRLGGFIFLSLQEYKNRVSFYKKGTYRIMCLGESITVGVGENSYPSQLEKVLNQRNIGIKFSVINKAVVLSDSSYIVAHLEENLNRYKPDMVTIMTGINDIDIKYYEGIPAANTLLFNKLRIYRFSKIIWIHILNKIRNTASDKLRETERNSKLRFHLLDIELKTFYPRLIRNSTLNEDLLKKAIELNPRNDIAYCALGWLYRDQGKYPEAEETFKKAIELNPKSDMAYCGLGWLCRSQGKYPQAEKFLKKAIELNPRNDIAYCALGWLYRDQGKYPQAEETFKKAIELNPINFYAYFGLGSIYRSQGKYPQAEETFKKAIELNPLNDRWHGALAALYQEIGEYASAQESLKKAEGIRAKYYNSMTWHNYQEVKRILDKRGIKLVCLQYPVRSIEPLKKIFEDEKGVIFVDNERIFKDALKKTSYKEYFTDMFGGDFGHCTRKGNRLLAENIANVILKEVFGK